VSETSPIAENPSETAPAVEDLPLLIVDDEPDVLRALERTIATAGLPVVATTSPEEAIRWISQREFSAVISDYWMPKVDGVKVLTAVREKSPHTERLLLTAYADSEALERGINEAAISRFLRKPWKRAVLLAILEQAMQQSRLRRERDLLLSRLHNRNQELSYVNRLLQSRVEASDRDMVRFRWRWDVALNAISDAILVVDDGYRIEGANEAAATLAGVTAEYLESRICHRAVFHRPEPCGGCPLGTGTGQVVSGEALAQRIFDARAYALGGVPASHLCVYRDITGELKFQQEAAHVEKMAAIGRLAGGIAHELNNPLHGILSFVQIAQKQGVVGDKVARALEVIHECALRCRDIVGSMRDFSRRPQAPEWRSVDLNDVCDKAIVLFGATGGRRIERIAGPERAACAGNANQLQQVLVNLIQNAIDASPPEGIVRIGVSRDVATVTMWVEDQGPGVPSPLRTKIFEPFYTTKPEGMGTGLGLSISHTIMQEHGGSLCVLDAASGGARFEASLPGDEHGQ